MLKIKHCKSGGICYEKAFVGFENETHPFTAVFGAEKGHPFIKEMLENILFLKQKILVKLFKWKLER